MEDHFITKKKEDREQETPKFSEKNLRVAVHLFLVLLQVSSKGSDTQ